MLWGIEGGWRGGLLGAGDEEGIGETLCARLFAADVEEVGATCGEAEAVEEAPRLAAEDLQPSMVATALALMDALPREVVDDPATACRGVLLQPAAASAGSHCADSQGALRSTRSQATSFFVFSPRGRLLLS